MKTTRKSIRIHKWQLLWRLLCTVLGLAPQFLLAQTVADPGFKVQISQPRYPAQEGPLVSYDVYHHNALSATGQYKAFADVVRAEGYRLRDFDTPISKEGLAHTDIFVTVNALSDPANWDLPTPSAYGEEEIERLYQWVHDHGGALLIITDQMPCAGAVGRLAGRFGFNVINGVAYSMDGQPQIFNRTFGNLLPSAVTDGEGRSVDQIRCWGGTAFIAPAGAQVFSVLDTTHRIYLPARAKDMEVALRQDIPYVSGLHLANGAILECGKGRVCIFANASPFAALLQGINSNPKGMNHPDAKDHMQLLRNILQWLHP